MRPCDSDRPIYLDYQASTPLDPAVFEAMTPWFLNEYGNPHSHDHAFGWRASAAIDAARQSVADAVGAEPEDIIFTSGATEANNLAILGTCSSSASRNTIVVSAIEHSSVLEPARRLRERGFTVIEVPVTSKGLVDTQILRAALNPRVALVSICAVNNEIGTVQNLRVLGDLCHSVGALFHTDAAQALLAIELRLNELPVDFASLASHKAHGPKGIGALYVAPGMGPRLVPMILGGGQQDGRRAGTLPTPLCVGFGAACRIVSEREEQERSKIRAIRDEALARLRALLPSIEVLGTLDSRHPGNLSVLLPVDDARDVVQKLQPHIACSTGSACHSGTEAPSHVLTALGVSARDARRFVRLGFGRFTKRDDLSSAVVAIAQAVADSTEMRSAGASVAFSTSEQCDASAKSTCVI